jgi:hypothetical protein
MDSKGVLKPGKKMYKFPKRNISNENSSTIDIHISKNTHEQADFTAKYTQDINFNPNDGSSQFRKEKILFCRYQIKLAGKIDIK